MNMNKSKKAKLLSSFAVMAMVVCAFAAVMPVVDGADAAVNSSTEKVGGLDISFESSLGAVVSDNKVTFTGSSTAGMAAGNSTTYNFNDIFVGSGETATPAAADYSAVVLTGITGADYFEIIQKNSALRIYDQEWNGIVGDTKTKVYAAVNAAAYEFLIPKDGSKVEITVKEVLKVDESDPQKVTEYGDEVTTYTFDFTHVSTKIVLKSDVTATMAEGTTETKPWDFDNGTLILTNYNGSEIFTYAGSLNVELSGENTITNHGLYDTGKSGAGASAISVTGTGNTLSVYAKDAGATLNIDCCNDIGFGITGTNVTIGKMADAGAEGKTGETTTPVRTVVNIDGGNRAIYATGASNTTAIQNADVIVEGAERGIRTINLTVTDSNVEAKLSTPVSNNEQGVDDYFGIKADGKLTVDTESKVTAQGLRLGGELDNKGIVAVSGNYEQNPDAIYTTTATDGLKVLVAGLYVDTATNATADRVASAGTEKGKIYLIGDAGAFNVTVTDGDKKEVTSTTVEDALTKLADENNSKVTLIVPAGTVSTTPVSVPEGKELTVVATENALNGIVKTGPVGNQSTATFEGVKGNFVISQGSVKLSSDEGQGMISEGTITLGERETLDIDVKVENLTVEATDGKKAFVTVKSDVEVTGTLSLGSGITMTNTGSITLAENAKIDVASNAVLKNNGSIIGQKGEVTGAGTFDNSGSVGCVVSTATVLGTTFDLEVSGEAVQDRTYGSLQNVIVPEGKVWTITTGTSITINGNLIVEGTLVIDGELIVAGSGAGTAKMTVEEGAVVTINEKGVLSIGSTTSAGDAVIDGTVMVYGVLNVIKTSETVAIGDNTNVADGVAVNGDMTVSTTGVVATGEDARMTVYGTFTMNGSFGYGSNDFALYDKGTVVINNAAAERPANVSGSGIATIYLAADDVSVDITSFLFEKQTSSLKITDEGLVLKKATKTLESVVLDDGAVNTIVFDMSQRSTYLEKATVGSIVVTEDVSTKKSTATGHTDDNVYTAKMDVSGSVAAGFTFSASSSNATVTDRVNMGIDGGDKVYFTGSTTAAEYVGGVTVASDLTIGNYVNLSNTGNMSVSGTVSALGANGVVMPITNQGDIEVTGLITASNKIAGTGTISAAYYVIITGTGVDAVTTYNYASFGTAVAAVADASNTNASKVVTIYGDLVVKENVDVPAGVTVNFDTEAKMTIGPETGGQDVVVKFASGAIMNNSAEEQVIVNGTLEFANKANDKTRDVVCDVTVRSEEKNGPVTYTNLLTALANAADGSVVEVTRQTGNVTLSSNLTLRDGITLYIPEGVASLYLKNGVTLTIDGVLKTESDIIAETKFSTTAMNVDAPNTANDKFSSAIVVNGYLYVNKGVSNSLEYGDSVDDSSTSGVNEAKLMSKGAPIAGAYYDYDGDWNVISTLENAIAVMDKVTSNITINGAVSAGDVSFVGNDDCTTINVDGKQVTEMDGTTKVNTTLTVSSLTLGDGMKFTMASSQDVTTKGALIGTITVGSASVVSVKATGIAAENVEGKLVLTGTTVADSSGESFAISAGTVYAGTTAATGGAFVMDGDFFSIATGATLEVVGTFTFDNLTVNGTFVVPSGKTANADASTGALVVNGTVTVAPETDSKAAGNLTVKDLYIGLTSKDVTGADASFSGPVTVNNIAYVKAGSSIDAVAQKILDKKDNTQFFVADVLWMTAYDFNGGNKVSTVDEAPVENAAFKGWVDSDGKNIKFTGTSSEYDPEIGASKTKKVTANIDYDVYTVYVYANEGIANVYIDGNAMAKGILPAEDISDGMANGFFLKVSAGEHEITYDLTNGWTGSAVFKVNGDAISGNKFTTTGTPGETDTVLDYYVQVSGLEKSGYVPDAPDSKDDSGMGITDYLLIVLVVLIIVMAIIVAMRLMRS
ncbi:beta strand repeat-containing protein [Candidatus Methanoprimaticola sp. MG2]|uniref:beta strand repeat-containing protein n=1 Tax=Candidatus Methanoprimaticola sp. MG2 TaxID=3228838 RepID=UPI0039C5B67C